MKAGVLISPVKNIASIYANYETTMKRVVPDSIWLPDRLLIASESYLKGVVDDNPPEYLDPFVTIPFLSSKSDTPPEFGIAVTDFVRRSALDLARASSTISQILKNPLNMGFGSGEAINLTPLDYAYGTAPVSHFEHQLGRYNEIKTTGIYTSSGTASIGLGYNNCSSRIWIGGQRERMLRLTAKYADGWLPAWKMPSSEYGEKAKKLEELANQYGRNKPELGMLIAVKFGETKQELLREIDANPLWKLGALNSSAETWKRWGLTHPAGSHSKGLPDFLVGDLTYEEILTSIQAVPAEFIAETACIGTVEDILNELWEYRQAGLEHLVVILHVDARTGKLIDDDLEKFSLVIQEVKAW